MIRYMNYEYMCQSFGHMHRIKYRCNSILQSAVDMVKKIVRGSIKIGGIEMNSNILLGIMIPFIGTTLGSAMVFFMKKEMNVRLQKMLLGFASGVMIAASVWSLHNIPEGMAVGVTFAGVMTENSVISLAGALALSIGIAIQNFPEGAIISMPLQSHGLSKGKAFLYGAMSGIVEPIAAVITIFLTGIAVPLLPYLLSFAAGAMIYVVVEELIPESQAGEHSNIGTIGVAAGFVLMMILDVALG